MPHQPVQHPFASSADGCSRGLAGCGQPPRCSGANRHIRKSAVDLPPGKEGKRDDTRKCRESQEGELQRDVQWSAEKQQEPKQRQEDKGKGKKKDDSKGGKIVHVTTDHPSNKNGWLIPLEVAMKDAPGVFTQIVDSFVLVTIKQMSMKYMLGLMDYQEAQAPDPINWIALFDFDHVDVDCVVNLYSVKEKDMWPPMNHLAMKLDFFGAEGAAGGVALQLTCEGMCPEIKIIMKN